MGDVALRGILLRCGALSSEVARAITIEAGVAGGGAQRSVLPAGVGAKVGGKPTAATDADASAAVEVDKWSRGGTPSGTSGEHYRTE
jgi:hypothetical protein